MILEFLLSQWKLVAIAALVGLLSIQTHRLSSAEKEIVAVSTQYQSAIDAAKAETAKAVVTNKESNDEANQNIPIAVAEAKRNAPELYKLRFGNIARNGGFVDNSANPSLGGGISANGMRDSGTDSSGSVQGQVPESVAGAPVILDARGTCDRRFIEEASRAAVIMRGIDIWLDANGFERE